MSYFNLRMQCIETSQYSVSARKVVMPFDICLQSRKIPKLYDTLHSSRYCLSIRNILLSSDVEMNPGPMPRECTPLITSPVRVWESRLLQYGLMPYDCGGGGDCFFKAVCHQLYGDPCT